MPIQTIQYINIGTSPNDGTGDTLRAGGNKINLDLEYIDGLLNNRISFITVTVDWSQSVVSQLRDYVNANPMTVEKDELVIFLMYKNISNDPMSLQLQQYRYLWVLGEGAFGGTNPIATNAFFNLGYVGGENESVYDLGEIGTSNIEDVVNQSGPYSLNSGATVVFQAERSGELVSYLYTGPTGTHIGLGEYQTSASEYTNLNTEEPVPPELDGFIHTTGDETKEGILTFTDYTVKEHSVGFVINNPAGIRLQNPANGAIIIKHPSVTNNNFVEYYVSILDNTNRIIGNIEAQIYFNLGTPANAKGGAIITSNTDSFNPTVEAALDASGNFCLVIGEDTQSFGFGSVILEKVTTSFGGGLDSSWKDDWSITQETDTTAYTSRVDLLPKKVALEDWADNKFVVKDGNTQNGYTSTSQYLSGDINTQNTIASFLGNTSLGATGLPSTLPTGFFGAWVNSIDPGGNIAQTKLVLGGTSDDDFYWGRTHQGVAEQWFQGASRNWVSNQNYLTSETDPIFTASPAFGITANEITDWNTAYGWGNHADAGYVPETRMLTAGNGINTIGDLSQDRNITLDFNYLDDRYTTGFKQKEAVRIATVNNITLSGLQTIGGITLVAGDRVLVKSQTNAADNGIYVASSTAWSRSTDFDTVTQGEIEQGASIFVEEGSILAKTGWTLATGGTIVLGTTPLEFIQYSGATNYAGGDNITIVGNEINHDAGSWVNKTALTAGNVISNLNVDQFGHITDWTTRNLDGRYELLSNKAVDFSTIDDTLYPTTKSVNDNFISTNPNSNNPSAANFSGDLDAVKGMNSFWYHADAIGRPDYASGGGMIMNLFSTAGSNAGVQVASGWNSEEFGYRIWGTGGGVTEWFQFASREWINSQGFLTSETPQTLSLSGDLLSISNGNSVDLSSINTDTQYSAGTGLSLNGTEFSFDTTFGDNRYVNVSGDTMTGMLTADGGIKMKGDLYTDFIQFDFTDEGTRVFQFNDSAGAYKGIGISGNNMNTGTPQAVLDGLWMYGASEIASKNYVQSGGYLTQFSPILTQAETDLFTHPNSFFRNNSAGIYPAYGAGMKIVYNDERANEIYFRGDQLDDGFYYRQSSGIDTWGAVHQVASREWVTDQNYLTSFSETDTLQSVINRGNVSNTGFTLNTSLNSTTSDFSSSGITQKVIDIGKGWSRQPASIELINAGTTEGLVNFGAFGSATDLNYGYLSSQLTMPHTNADIKFIDGKVGVNISGNNAPTHNLHVEGDARITGTNNFLTLDSVSAYTGIEFKHTSGTKYLQHSNGGDLVWGSDTLPANNETVYHTGNLTSNTQLANGAGYITSTSLPTVNDGTLTMATGTGLTGTDTFSANQAANTTFTVGLSTATQASLAKADTALQSETDPIFTASPAFGITANNITSWNNKFNVLSNDFNSWNLNTYGVYEDVTNSATGTPTVSGGNFHIFSFTTNAGTQLALQNNNDALWTRSVNSSGVFGSWVESASKNWVESQNYLTADTMPTPNLQQVLTQGSVLTTDQTIETESFFGIEQTHTTDNLINRLNFSTDTLSLQNYNTTLPIEQATTISLDSASAYVVAIQGLSLNLSSNYPNDNTSTLHTDLLTQNRDHQLPDGDGTLALKSDITSAVNNGTLNLVTGSGIAGSGTFTANQAGNSNFSIGLTAAAQASLDLADTSVQPGDDISVLNNDAGYISSLRGRPAVIDVIDSGITMRAGMTLVITNTQQICPGTPCEVSPPLNPSSGDWFEIHSMDPTCQYTGINGTPQLVSGEEYLKCMWVNLGTPATPDFQWVELFRV